MKCDICTSQGDNEDIKHLAIYVFGSEGVKLCLNCRMVLTHVIRGMITAVNHGILESKKKGA